MAFAIHLRSKWFRPPIRNRLSTSWRMPRRPYSSKSVLSASQLENKVQVYVSLSDNPFLNLAFESHLLKKTHADSVALFMYSNSHCTVIGRNQNPWKEVNLTRLAIGVPREGYRHNPTNFHKPVLMRRRSGGGTVWHDPQNLNWCVIGPAKDFHRDKHAEMVVKALHQLGFKNTKVNERHDIVMDKDGVPFKVSGSAYKVTRLRAMHHGTALLNSPNLVNLSAILDAPVSKHLDARGSESVKSPVTNIGIDKPSKLMDAITKQFKEMYGDYGRRVLFGKNMLEDEMVKQEADELADPAWIFKQTPQFTFNTHPESGGGRPPPGQFRMSFTVRHGIITECQLSGLASRIPPELALAASERIAEGKTRQMGDPETDASPSPLQDQHDEATAKQEKKAQAIDDELAQSLVGTALHTIENWIIRFTSSPKALLLSNAAVMQAGRYMNHLFYNKEATLSDSVKHSRAATSSIDAFVIDSEKGLLRRGNKLRKEGFNLIHSYYLYVARSIRHTARTVLGRYLVQESRRADLLAVVTLQEELLVSLAASFCHQKLWSREKRKPAEMLQLSWNLRACRIKLEGKLREGITFRQKGEFWRPDIKIRGTRSVGNNAPWVSPRTYLRYIVAPNADLGNMVPRPPYPVGPLEPCMLWRQGLIILAEWEMLQHLTPTQVVWLMAEGITPRYDQRMSIPRELESKRERLKEKQRAAEQKEIKRALRRISVLSARDPNISRIEVKQEYLAQRRLEEELEKEKKERQRISAATKLKNLVQEVRAAEQRYGRRITENDLESEEWDPVDLDTLGAVEKGEYDDSNKDGNAGKTTDLHLDNLEGSPADGKFGRPLRVEDLENRTAAIQIEEQDEDWEGYEKRVVATRTAIPPERENGAAHLNPVSQPQPFSLTTEPPGENTKRVWNNWAVKVLKPESGKSFVVPDGRGNQPRSAANPDHEKVNPPGNRDRTTTMLHPKFADTKKDGHVSTDLFTDAFSSSLAFLKEDNVSEGEEKFINSPTRPSPPGPRRSLSRASLTRPIEEPPITTITHPSPSNPSSRSLSPGPTRDVVPAPCDNALRDPPNYASHSLKAGIARQDGEAEFSAMVKSSMAQSGRIVEKHDGHVVRKIPQERMWGAETERTPTVERKFIAGQATSSAKHPHLATNLPVLTPKHPDRGPHPGFGPKVLSFNLDSIRPVPKPPGQRELAAIKQAKSQWQPPQIKNEDGTFWVERVLPLKRLELSCGPPPGQRVVASELEPEKQEHKKRRHTKDIPDPEEADRMPHDNPWTSGWRPGRWVKGEKDEEPRWVEGEWIPDADEDCIADKRYDPARRQKTQASRRRTVQKKDENNEGSENEARFGPQRYLRFLN